MAESQFPILHAQEPLERETPAIDGRKRRWRQTSISPRSASKRLATLDKRRWEHAFMQDVRKQLMKHIGGAPSAVQAKLIERIAMLSLYVELFDRKAIDDGIMSEQDSRKYLAFSNSLVRLLAAIGISSKRAAKTQTDILHKYLERPDNGEI